MQKYNITVLCYVTYRILIEVHRRFGGRYCHHLLSQRVIESRKSGQRIEIAVGIQVRIEARVEPMAISREVKKTLVVPRARAATSPT
jgi:hypothetical protein